MTDIVYITVDSLRADHVGWHGYERDTTPFLDQLCDESHTFLNAFSNGCYTRRSFPSIMTSEYPAVCMSDGGLSDEYTTLAQALSAEGYETGGFHSNPHLLPKFGYDKGFDTFYDSDSESSKVARLRQWVKDTLPKESILYRTLERTFARTEQAIGFNPGTPFVLAEDLTNKAINWVQSTSDGPRFLWIHYMDVHHPYSPPEQHQLAFRDATVPEKEAVKLRRKMVDEPENVTDKERQTLIDLYDGEIRYMDAQVKRLVEEIRSRWGEDTIIAFTSDHGEEFGDHSDFSHRDTLYDELLHVPLLISSGNESTVHDDVVSLMDIPPTFLDMVDGKIPTGFRGQSLKPLINGESVGDTYAIGDQGKTISYRDKRWKYITGPDREELYSIEGDPNEQTNVVGEHPDVVAEISEKLAQYPELGKDTESDLNADDLGGQVQDRLEQLGYLQE